jgi:RNA polymerase sigma-70 factor (ECF subfamily)
VPRDMAGSGSDTELLARFASGDRVAARVLTDRLAPPILRFAARMLADRAEAEDVTQETLLRLWHMAPDWQDTGIPPLTWAYRVAANLCTDRLRRTRRQVSEMPDLADGRASVAQDMMQQARVDALQAALALLPDRQRQAVILRHIEGLANPQIAAILMVGVEAVESLTARGKRNLAALLAGQRAELGYEDDD